MKTQAAMEFLTTYGFMFLVLSIALVLILIIASALNAYVPSSCSGVSGLNCGEVIYKSNSMTKSSVLTLGLGNAQSTPVNVVSVNSMIDQQLAYGKCTPTFLIPGSSTTCTITFAGTAKRVGATVTGAYVANVMLCTSGLSQFTQKTCNYTQVYYTGQFKTQALPG